MSSTSGNTCALRSVASVSKIRSYDAEEARNEGVRQALLDALNYFWTSIDALAFSKLCLALLRAERIELQQEGQASETHLDALGRVLLIEPAGFRRVEQWGFEFKHHKDSRVSTGALQEASAYVETMKSKFDVLCLVTSGDLTSIATYVAVRDIHLRVWDRFTLNYLVNQHWEALREHFAEYSSAVETLSQPLDIKHHAEFDGRLERCSPGLEDFSEYQNIGVEIWSYLFQGTLGDAKPQNRTQDGKQIRDVLFPNRRAGPFFQRIFDRFDADFVIVDFKNHRDPVTADVINDVAKYANKALGKFIVVVSRAGLDPTAKETQLRLYRDSDKVVLVVSDAQMLEMVKRKEQGEHPEDTLGRFTG